MVDISYNHASDDIFAMERTGPQLFGWRGSHRYSTTFSICHRTLARQTVVCIYCIDNGDIIILYRYIHNLYVTIQAEVSYSDRQESEGDE